MGLKKIFFCSLSFFCTFLFKQISAEPSLNTKALNLLSGSGISAIFAAKFTLFLATILFGTIVIGKVLKLAFRLPTVAGQIIGGIVLGPSLLNIQQLKIFAEPLKIIDSVTQQVYTLASTDIFMFFILLSSTTLTVAYLLWIAGHETDVQDMAKVGLVSTIAGFLASITPIFMITATIYYIFKYNIASSIGISAVFAATSVSIPVAMLVSQKKMNFRFAKATMGAAIIDDILAIVLFSLFTISLQSGILGSNYCSAKIGHNCSIANSLFYMLLSFLIIFLTGKFIIQPSTKFLKRKHFTHLIPPFAITMMLTYFSVAELLGGLAGITGAYFAGLFHRMGDEKHHAEKVISPYVNIFLLPLFLGSVGMQVKLADLNLKSWMIVITILLAAILSKLIGCYASTFISDLLVKNPRKNWSLLETYLFGSSMVARGEVGLVLATILKGTQIISSQQYVICVTVIVLTTIVTPVMLSLGFAKLDKVLKEKAIEKIRSIKIMPLNHLSLRQIFSLISTIDLPSPINSVVQLSEAKKVLTLSNKLKVILKPEEGIIIEGQEKQINELLAALKNALDKDIDLIPSHLPQLELHI